MNCKKCGYSLTENDQFCKNCGVSTNETNAQSLNLRGNGNSYVGQGVNNGIGSQPMNQQPMYQQQSSWQSGYTSQPYNQPQPKNNGNTKFIIIGIVIAIAIFAGMIIVTLISEDDNYSTNNGLSNGGNNTNTTQTSKSTYKVNFKGFTFSIPDNLVYEEDSGALLIGDESGTWIAQIEIEQGNFSQIKANKSQLQSLMQQNGFISSIASEKTLGGIDFITLEVSHSGQNAIMAIAKANSMYFAGITAFNQDNDFDYSLLETIAPILSSSTYTGETTNMATNTRIDMSLITELAK